MSFGKSKVERFNYYPTPNPSTRSGTSLSASLPSASAWSLSMSSQSTPIKSGMMSSQHNQRPVKRNISKCNSTGGKGKLTSQRIPAAPLTLSRSNRVVLPTHGCSPSLRLGRVSGNRASRKSGTLKRKTPKTFKTSIDFMENSVSCGTASSLEIFQTPLSSPRVAEFGDGAQTVKEEKQQEIELQIKSDYELFSLTNNPSSAYPPSEVLSPPLHESTLVVPELGQDSENVSDATDESVSVITPGRTPRRLTNRRIIIPSQVENIRSVHSNPSPTPLPHRPSSSTATIQRTDVNSIPARGRVSTPPGYQSRSLQTVSPESLDQLNRSIGSETETITIRWCYPVPLRPLRNEEPPPEIPSLTSVIAERAWPSWRLPDSIPSRCPFDSWDRDVDLDLGKYHKPMVIAASFYNWIMDRLFRRNQNTKRREDFDGNKLPEPVPNSITNDGHLDPMLSTVRPYPFSHEMLLQQQERHAMNENQVQVLPAKAAFDFGERVKTTEFWVPFAELVAGQVVADILSSMPHRSNN